RRRSSNGQGGGESQSAGNERQGGGTVPEGGTEHESSRPPEVAVETSPPSAPQPAWSNERRPSPFSGGVQGADRRPEPRTLPFEVDERGLPTTTTRSTSLAASTAASCRSWVARNISLCTSADGQRRLTASISSSVSQTDSVVWQVTASRSLRISSRSTSSSDS